jgi:hypothetical protein
MDPAASSAFFSLGGLLLGLIVSVLLVAGVTLTGMLLHVTATSIYARYAPVRWCVDWIWDRAVYKPPAGDAKECLDALKSRLTAIEKLTWFFLTLIATAFVASISPSQTMKLATLELPKNLFTLAFFVCFIASMLYYVKLLGALQKIFRIAPNSADIQMHVAVGSGFLSPLSESSSVTGWISDLLGFCLLIGAWWAAFAAGVRLLNIDPNLNRSTLGEWLPWIAVIVGVLALFSIKGAMESMAQSRALLITKLSMACLSVPLFFLLVARSHWLYP